jgi:hypothetical protein
MVKIARGERIPMIATIGKNMAAETKTKKPATKIPAL